MTELTSSDWRALADGIRELHADPNLETFPVRLLRVVRRLVPGDTVPYEECDPNRRRTVGIQDPADARPGPADMAVWAHHVHQHPIIAHWQRTGTDATHAISDLVSRAAWHRTGLYGEMMARYEVEDQLGMLIADRKPLVIALAVNRSRRGFSGRDKQVFELLRPHVAQAYHHCELVADLKVRLANAESALAEAAAGSGVGEGVITLDAAGHIASVDARARLLCMRYFAAWGRAPMRLPPPLWDWVCRERAAARTEEGTLAARAAMTVAGPTGGRLTARLIPAGPDGAAGLLLLLSERPAPAPATDETPPAPPAGQAARVAALSPRYRRVLAHMLRGESEKQIAAALSLSPHTVHEYVKTLYKELGVNSRAELASLWIRRPGP